MIGTSSFRSVDPRFHGKSSDPTDPEVITDAELDYFINGKYRIVIVGGRPEGQPQVRDLAKALRACRHGFRCVAEQAAELGRLLNELGVQIQGQTELEAQAIEGAPETSDDR